MHATIEELRDLANAYVKEKILNDKQLKVKKHMAECDECYGIFCTTYLIQKELYAAALIPEDVLDVPEESIVTGMIMQISKVKEKLALSVQNAFLNDAKWDFRNIQYMAVARGGNEAELYQSRGSKESRILYEDGRLLIELDEEKYEGNKLYLLVIDGDNRKRIDFAYDEDMEMYRIVVNLKDYSDDVVLNINECEK